MSYSIKGMTQVERESKHHGQNNKYPQRPHNSDLIGCNKCGPEVTQSLVGTVTSCVNPNKDINSSNLEELVLGSKFSLKSPTMTVGTARRGRLVR